MHKIFKIWFVTDIHGSNICFHKFLNSLKIESKPDVIILGADISGKYLIPILQFKKNYWEYFFEGKKIIIKNEHDFLLTKTLLGNKGVYYKVCEDNDIYKKIIEDRVFYEKTIRELRIERLREWVELADSRQKNHNQKVIINCGNDDPWYLDDVLATSKTIIVPEGKIIYLNDELTIISTGLANMTPWKCPRDVSEEKLKNVIDTMVNKVPDFTKCLFNFHCPPINTSLDLAPKLDKKLNMVLSGAGVVEESVGSIAVRTAIEKYQPLISLHGHIHENHTFEKIGKTICCNPGSEYYQGLLNGVYIEFENNHLKQFFLTREYN